MRCAAFCFVLISLTLTLIAADRPVEKNANKLAVKPTAESFLHSGKLADGIQAMSRALDGAPQDDQLRFELAVLQIVEAVEHLGQRLFEFGCRSENSNLPFVRLPIPANPQAKAITYQDYRLILSDFQKQLAAAELILNCIQDPEVTMTLKLADIRLDFDRDGQSEQRLSDILAKLMGRQVAFPNNPAWQVRFDRGDVAWLRAYCHLLMALVDFQLAFDVEEAFNVTSDELFTNPSHPFRGSAKDKANKLYELSRLVVVQEPKRLGQFRKHLISICELNQETWKFIRAETDNDFEWLPSARQTGVLGLPVSDAMVDAWLAMLDEVQKLLEGKTVIPAVILLAFGPDVDAGLSIQRLLDDPPARFEWERIAEEGLAPKYLNAKAENANMLKIIRVFQTFQSPLAVGYAIWFN